MWKSCVKTQGFALSFTGEAVGEGVTLLLKKM